MKPEQARALTINYLLKNRPQFDVKAYLEQNPNKSDAVPLDVLPSEKDLDEAMAEAHKLMKLLERLNRHQIRYQRKLDELVRVMARIVFIERILEIDRIERAGLKAPRVLELATVTPDDLSRRLARMRGDLGLEVPA